MITEPPTYPFAEGAGPMRLRDVPRDGSWEYQDDRLGERWLTRTLWRTKDNHVVLARPKPKPPVMVEVPAQDIVDRLCDAEDPRRAGADSAVAQRLLDAAWAALDAEDAK